MAAVGSRLRLRHRAIPAAAFYRAFRSLLTLVLMASLALGGYRFFSNPRTAGALEFTPHAVSVISDAKQVLSIASADIDGDGRIDIITAGNDGLKIYKNAGSGEFENYKLVSPTRARRVQIEDFTGDGQLDILATFDSQPSVRWYENEGGLEFSENFVGTGNNGVAYASDINEDGLIDIVTAMDTSGTWTVDRWINDGGGTFTSGTFSVAGNPAFTAITAGNIDENNYDEVIVSGEAGLQVYRTIDGVTWSRSDLDDSETDATSLVVGEVSGDGRNDLLVAKQADDALYVYKYVENFQFQKVTLNPAIDATTMVVKDLDEDGDEDIIATGQDNNSVYWFDNQGGAEFERRTLASDLSSVFGVTVADLDGDGDFDFATADYTRGTVWWYERTRAKPVATEPTNIRQTTDGSGRITFDTDVSDSDFDPTRVRVQYSLDGDHWYKPWITKVTPSAGSVDLKNSNGYQVGTNNGIDTENGKVTLIFTWDTKSTGNTGGPLNGDFDTVQLRIIPRDARSVGAAAVSNQFRVDNVVPQGLEALTVTSTNIDEVALSWNRPSDSSPVTYKIYFGTDHAAVLEQRSEVWDENDDSAMADLETSSTTVTDLAENKTYTFKLYVTDAYGNQVAVPSVRATTVESQAATTPEPGATTVPTTSPVPTTGATPTTSTEPAPGTTPEPTESTEPGATPLFPTATPNPTPTPEPTLPSTTFDNEPPSADAGIDQAVNPSALVILDGTASFDSDGDPLTFSWRQLSGPSVELFSGRTATPSFSAGSENETYIFALTVRDQVGASATDTITVAVKPLPPSDSRPVDSIEVPDAGGAEADQQPTIVRFLLAPLDVGLFLIAVLLTALSLGERLVRAWRDRKAKKTSSQLGANVPKGKVVHHRTGDPIADALVFIYGADGKLRSRDKTNVKGEFATLFPPGQYTIKVQADNFTFAPAASLSIRPEEGILYSGGKITVPEGGRPLNIVIPMRPIGKEVSSIQTQVLHSWQTIQRVARLLSWPVFIIGSLLNTALIFWAPGALFLVIEVLYVFLVIVKVAMEVRIRPAYGLVRDSITHVPIDLAVVRLFETGTNRLVMTRITDGRGKFFALPPSGSYTVTITKPGYAVFSKTDVKITTDQDSVLQMTADLMPVAPVGGLAAARGAVL